MTKEQLDKALSLRKALREMDYALEELDDEADRDIYPKEMVARHRAEKREYLTAEGARISAEFEAL